MAAAAVILSGGATAAAPLPSVVAEDVPPVVNAPVDAPAPPAPEGDAQTNTVSPEPPPPAPRPAPPPPPVSEAIGDPAGADVAPAPWSLLSSGLAPLQVHAFASQGFIKSSKNNYLVNSTRGSFEFTELGINFTQPLGDQFRFGAQLFARQLGKVGDYRARVDWFYLDYSFADWLGLRIGRTKVPFGLYNDVADVDSARLPVLLPQAVYPTLNRDILLALTGLELHGYLALGLVGGLEYRLYGGTLYVDSPGVPAGLPAGTILKDFQVPYVMGGRLMWDTPVAGLRAGGSFQALRFNTQFSIPTMDPTMPLRIDEQIPFRLWLASIEYTGHDFLLVAEYGRWKADLEITGLPILKVTNERYYAMAGYRVMPWFMPGAYFSSLVPNVDHRSGRENYQYDWATVMRFDLNAHWLLKLEGHFIRGTNELSSDLNGGTPLNMLSKDWLLFMAKTTAYF